MECRLHIKSQQRSGQSEDAGVIARQAKQTRENDRRGALVCHPRAWLSFDRSAAAREGSRFLALICLLLVVVCGGTQIKRVDYTDIAGNHCQTVKVHPDWYSAETSTACVRGGEVITVDTHHTDASIFYGAAAIVAAAISVATF
jgi:hypothetical protein